VNPVSAAAIFLLFWTMCLFLVLPFGVVTAEEAGETCEPGHAESSPHNFRFGRVALRASLLAAVLFGLFYANWIYGWLRADMLEWISPPRGR
jgi:predicted secreted protein